MPYIPRSYASTSVPSVVDIPKRATSAGKREQIAYRPDPVAAKPPTQVDENGKLKIRSTLSIRGHTVDPLRVYQMLTGKEPNVDEHSRQLV